MDLSALKEFKQPKEGDGESFPYFEQVPNDAEEIEGSRLEFCCIVKGNPLPKVVWRKGLWLEISHGERHDTHRDVDTGECKMVIKSARAADSGKYKVVATNYLGEFTHNFSIEIRGLPSTEPVENFKTVKTHLKRREVKPSEKKSHDQLETEVLQLLSKADPKDYEKICFDHGFYDFRMMLHKLKKLEKIANPQKELEAERVRKSLKHVKMIDHSTAVFETQLEHLDPEQQFDWYKDGEIMPLSRLDKRRESLQIGDVLQLIIRDVNLEDSGLYTLDINGQKLDAMLTINEANPEFEKELESQRGKIGDRCEFECVTNSNQQVDWYKNGTPLDSQDDQRLQMLSEGSCHRLVISELNLDDEGLYSAKIGELESTAELTVDHVDFSNVTIQCDVIPGKVSLSWKLPENTDEGLVDGYLVERSLVGEDNWEEIGRSNVSEFTCTDGKHGQTYVFRVSPITEQSPHTSAFSEPVKWQLKQGLPLAVNWKSIKMESSTHSSITVKWEKAESNENNSVLGYIIEKKGHGSSHWSRCNDRDGLSMECKYTVANLQANTEYEFRIISVNSAGESTPSNSSVSMKVPVLIDPSMKVNNLELVDSTSSSLSLKWNGYENSDEAEFLGFELEFQKKGSDEWVKGHYSYINGTSYSLRGLEQGQSYRVRIRSVCDQACSEWSYSEEDFVAQEFYDLPTINMTSELEAIVADGIIIDTGETIRISVPYHSRIKPDVIWTKNDKTVDEVEEDITNSDGATLLVIRNCCRSHSGSYKVMISNEFGSKTLSIKVTVRDVPRPPTGPLEVNVNKSDVLLRWQPPCNYGDDDVIGYTVQKRDARGRNWSTLAQGVGKCSFRVLDLPKQISYYFRVLAENHLGTSEPLQSDDIVFFKQEVEKVKIDFDYKKHDLTKPPYVTVPLKAREVVQGVKVTLSCSISGEPHPVIKWFKDDQEIFDNSDCSKENVVGLCRLVIRNTKVSDAGLYKVVGENPVGVATSEAALVVTN